MTSSTAPVDASTQSSSQSTSQSNNQSNNRSLETLMSQLNHRQDRDDDESDEDDLSDVETTVDLGFLVDDEPSANQSLKLTRTYFPSKVGGRPAWLNAKHIPESLICSHCSKPLSFLIQLYAPLRDQSTQSNHTSTFHRTLYVFACTDLQCLKKDQAARKQSNNQSSYQSIKCFRSQLPLHNDTYSHQPPPKLNKQSTKQSNKQPKFTSPETSIGAVDLCVRCGLRVDQSINQNKYCSSHCATLDKQIIEQSNNQSNIQSTNQSNNQSINLWRSRAESLLAEFEVTIESEYIGSQSDVDLQHEKELLARYEARIAEEKQEAENQTAEDIDEDEADECDESNGLSALEKHGLYKRDHCFTVFKRRISCNPEQIVRYERDGLPLWVSDDNQLSREQIPSCSHCGSPRVFEFQILPQLIYYWTQQEQENKLYTDTSSDSEPHSEVSDMEWGTVAVFTCSQSCGDGTKQYFDEYVHVQDHSELMMIEQPDDQDGQLIEEEEKS